MLEFGRYFSGLTRFRQYFPKEQIFVVLYEDIQMSPDKVLRGVYDFVGVENSYIPPILHQNVSPGIIPRHLWGERLRIYLNRTLTNTCPRVIDWIRAKGLAERYRRWNRKADTSPFHVDPDVWEVLSQEYESEVRGISQYVGRSLEHWLRPPEYKEIS